MVKKIKDSDFEIKFWKDWLYGDLIKRLEMVEKLPIIKEIENLNKLPEKIRKHVLTQLLNGFFEDLESAVYTKIRLDSKRK